MSVKGSIVSYLKFSLGSSLLFVGIGYGVFSYFEWRDNALREPAYPIGIEAMLGPLKMEFKSRCAANPTNEELEKILERRDSLLRSYACPLQQERWYCYRRGSVDMNHGHKPEIRRVSLSTVACLWEPH